MRYVALAALIIAGVAHAEPSAVAGIGSRTCGQFAEAYKKSPSATEIAFFTWAQGFMAGQNVSLMEGKKKARDLFGKSTESQEAFIRSYCDTHPLTGYWLATLTLFESLPEMPPR
jgi:hypothetical protein